MKVIFLDFNGVLDTYDNMDVINKDNLERLKTIVSTTCGKIVISSSLKNRFYYTGTHSRLMIYLLNSLKNNGIDVIDITPLADTRENEIRMYLETHPDIDSFCILDDDYYMESFKDNLIKLVYQNDKGNGLTDQDVLKAINILNGYQKKKS